MTGESSSSQPNSPSSPRDDRLLLSFYQKKFEEYQKTDDNYKEKIDRHLKNLVSDRHELEEEVLRRGGKISDLQKALVELQLSVFEERERFLRVSAENEELKIKEEKLHENMRQLLSMTHQKDLRDKIIYIMKDPTVEIGYRQDFPSKSKSADSDLPVDKKLKEEMEYLKKKMNEVLNISKQKSDIVLEDCKQALEKSREKIMQDDLIISELQKRLHDLKAEKENASANTRTAGTQFSRSRSQADDQLFRHKSAEANFSRQGFSGEDQISRDQSLAKDKLFRPTSSAEARLYRHILSSEDPPSRHSSSANEQLSGGSSSAENNFSNNLPYEDQLFSHKSSTNAQVPGCKSNSVFSKSVPSYLKDIHLSLILLMKVVSKICSILDNIQATKVFQRTAKISRDPTVIQDYVESRTVTQLETYLRQCTRLTFDIDNMHKALTENISDNERKVKNLNALQTDLNLLQNLLKELSASTAYIDLLNVGLNRSVFYSLLKGTETSTKGDIKSDLSDFKKIVSNCDSLSKAVSKTIDFVEKIIQTHRSSSSHIPESPEYLKRYASMSLETEKELFDDVPKRSASAPIPVQQSQTTSSAELENLLGIYRRAMHEAENLGFGLEAKGLSEKLLAIQKKLKDEEKLRIKKSYLDDNTKDETSQTCPKQKRSEVSQTDPKLKQSEMSQTDPKQKTWDEFYEDYVMRDEVVQTVPTLRKSEISQTVRTLRKSEISQTVPTLRKSEISQTVPTLRKSEISQTVPTLRKSEISQTVPTRRKSEMSQTAPSSKKSGETQTYLELKKSKMAQTDGKQKTWDDFYKDYIMQNEMSQTEPYLRKTGISQTDPEQRKSEVSQTDPKLKKSEVSQTDSKLRKSYKDFIMLDEISQTDPKQKRIGTSQTDSKRSRSDDIIRQINKIHSKMTSSDDYYRNILGDEAETDPKSIGSDDVLRKINKTLCKVKKMELGEYFKDDAMCLKLAENVNELNRKFRELTDEFSLRFVQDQFSEYSRMTLSKLEELAKQSRDTVVAAQAQIEAHRSNSKDLSKKLMETEELLRDSINESLSLKRKVNHLEQQRELDKYAFLSGIRENLKKISPNDDVETVVNDLIDDIAKDKRTSEVARPFVCVYCQQGEGHKLCEEKMRELRAEERKTKTLLKLLQQEMKEEKASQKRYKELVEKVSSDLDVQNNTAKQSILSLEKKNAVLLEQLKVEKNRVKNMERFRRLEIEGFQTDIKNLKVKIRDMEKQLLKAVLIFEEDKKDMELLRTVHETAQRSKQATAALRRLKAKLYELENDIKHL